MMKCLRSSQFNFTKEMFVAEIAEYFQQAGFTTLTYDPRSIGQSDGSPRNNIPLVMPPTIMML